VRFLKTSFVSFFNNHLINYPTPFNLNFLFSFGSLAGLFLVSQILTGFLLCMHYSPEINLAWLSIEHILRDVSFGWVLRYFHSNGAGFFFIIIYLHIGKGLFFKSYRKKLLWATGILIFVLMMATAFIGYVLPWGTMSFWGCMVITNLFSALPFVGKKIVLWLWGGFSINNATLNRFFSFHYILPFLIVAIVILHLSLLHLKGSTNPIGANCSIYKIDFYPFFLHKDVFSFFGIVLIFSFFVFFAPNFLGHSDNYIKANPLITPLHIVPEFYFLPFYAILRAIPSKLGGVFFMFFAIVCLFLVAFFDIFSFTPTGRFKVLFKFGYWFFVFLVLFLGVLGQKNVEFPYIFLSQISTLLYFSYFLIFLPFINFLDLYLVWK